MSPNFWLRNEQKILKKWEKEKAADLVLHYSSIIWAISLSNARLATQHYSSAEPESTYIHTIHTHTLGIKTSKTQTRLSVREGEGALTPFFVLISHLRLQIRPFLFHDTYFLGSSIHTFLKQSYKISKHFYNFYLLIM